MARGVGEQFDRLQQVMGDHRHHHVEVEIRAERIRPGNRRIVADDLGGDHHHGLGDHRVHLRGHDRAARLQLGNADLTDPAARAGREPSEVVGDVRQADRRRLERSGGLDGGIPASERLEGVGRGAEVQARLAAQDDGHPAGELKMRIDSRADRRAADRQLGQRFGALVEPTRGVADLCRVARELLAEPDRDGVLKVGPRDLDDVVERGGALGEPQLQPLQGRDQSFLQALQRGDVDGGRDHVVGRLSHIDGVVGMHRRLAAAHSSVKRLVGDPGDHLVHVHVGRGAAAGLEDVHDELIVELAVGDELRRLHDRRAQRGRQEAEVHVDLRRRLLDQAERAEVGTWEAEGADLKVPPGALRLRPVIGLLRDLQRAHRVFLGACRRQRSVPLDQEFSRRGLDRHEREPHQRITNPFVKSTARFVAGESQSQQARKLSADVADERR